MALPLADFSSDFDQIVADLASTFTFTYRATGTLSGTVVTGTGVRDNEARRDEFGEGGVQENPVINFHAKASLFSTKPAKGDRIVIDSVPYTVNDITNAPDDVTYVLGCVAHDK